MAQSTHVKVSVTTRRAHIIIRTVIATIVPSTAIRRSTGASTARLSDAVTTKAIAGIPAAVTVLATPEAASPIS
jgi:hypothetical protein